MTRPQQYVTERSNEQRRCIADPLVEVHLVVVTRPVANLERLDPLVCELPDGRAVVPSPPGAALDGGPLHRQPAIGINLRRERLRGGTARPRRVQVARLVPAAGSFRHRPEGATVRDVG